MICWPGAWRPAPVPLPRPGAIECRQRLRHRRRHRQPGEAPGNDRLHPLESRPACGRQRHAYVFAGLAGSGAGNYNKITSKANVDIGQNVDVLADNIYIKTQNVLVKDQYKDGYNLVSGSAVGPTCRPC